MTQVIPSEGMLFALPAFQITKLSVLLFCFQILIKQRITEGFG